MKVLQKVKRTVDGFPYTPDSSAKCGADVGVRQEPRLTLKLWDADPHSPRRPLGQCLPAERALIRARLPNLGSMFY